MYGLKCVTINRLIDRDMNEKLFREEKECVRFYFI